MYPRSTARRGGSTNTRYGTRGRGGRAGRNAPRSTAPKGLFADGIWHCDCTPRLPAEHFKVKKEGKNQGRWFYTCQNAQDKRCGFFLWDEDAKVREEGAVLGNSRTEVNTKRPGGVQEGWDAGRARAAGSGGMFSRVDPAAPSSRTVVDDDSETEDESPPPPYTTQRQPAGGTKRTADAAGFHEDQEEEDETFPWPLTGQEEDELAKAADAVVPPNTPRKALKTGIYATPATTEKKRKIPWLEEPDSPPATPSIIAATSQPHGYFTTPSKPSSKTLLPIPQDDAPATPSIARPTTAPAPNSPSPPTRHKDALFNPADSSSSLTSGALAILSSTAILPDTMSSLRAILSKHDLKTQGIMKGRDITRLALKAKDAKIAELQARIASLEAEREVDRGVLKKMRWDKEKAGDSGDEL